MRIVVGCHALQCFLSTSSDPLRRGKVHVTLAKVDAICWKIGSTEPMLEDTSYDLSQSILEDGPDVLSKSSPLTQTRGERDQIAAVGHGFLDGHGLSR